MSLTVPPTKKVKHGLRDQTLPDFELLSEASCLVDRVRPEFEYIPQMLTANEVDSIQGYASASLGDDPSSKHFICRKKSIAFVLLVGGSVYPLQRDYFVQNASYNDFSGGLRRYYTTIPDDVLQSSLKGPILRFAEYWGIPDRSVVLVQLQSSIIDPSDATESGPEDDAKRFAHGRNDVTGQGIHTDGADRAMLLCCERANVLGAENSFHASLDGARPLCAPRALAPGDALLFKDNALFHHVSDAFPADPARPMSRTMLLMHYPGEIYLDGARNPANVLPARPSPIVLRARADRGDPRSGALSS